MKNSLCEYVCHFIIFVLLYDYWKYNAGGLYGGQVVRKIRRIMARKSAEGHIWGQRSWSGDRKRMVSAKDNLVIGKAYSIQQGIKNCSGNLLFFFLSCLYMNFLASTISFFIENWSGKKARALWLIFKFWRKKTCSQQSSERYIVSPIPEKYL